MAKIVPAEHVDPWYWEAIYDDGATLEELEDDGTLHGFREIDQERLVAFILRPLFPHLSQYAVQLNPGKRLIFFRKRRKTLDMNSGEQRDEPPYQCIGYQETVNGKNVKSYVFVNIEGSSLLTDDHNAV